MKDTDEMDFLENEFDETDPDEGESSDETDLEEDKDSEEGRDDYSDSFYDDEDDWRFLIQSYLNNNI